MNKFFYISTLLIGFMTAHFCEASTTMHHDKQQVAESVERVDSIKIDLVKVDKSTRKMYLYAGEELVKKYHIALGSNPKGHKQQAGDERTPEGIYSLDYTKEDSAFYRAMHISYPNELDIQRAKSKGVNPGGFIMIHGQKNGKDINPNIAQRLNWTDGCIALKNHEMDEFLQLVETGTTIKIQW